MKRFTILALAMATTMLAQVPAPKSTGKPSTAPTTTATTKAPAAKREGKLSKLKIKKLAKHKDAK